MKKRYEKPQIVFEDFAMTTNIAGDCEFTTTNPTRGSCGYPTRNGIVFITELTGCKHHRPDTNDALCYHVPIDTHTIFNS